MDHILLSAKLSRSSSIQNSRDLLDEAHKWQSIKSYIYLANSLASSNINFDMFSTIRHPVKLFDIIILELTVAMSYAFMDFFIKLYTGVLDFDTSLNPLLKGITYGKLIQSALWTVIHANELSDSMMYLANSILPTAGWNTCRKGNINCTNTATILLGCINQATKTNILHTSTHYYHRDMFYSHESNLTQSIFMFGIIWIVNFFVSSVNSVALIKIMRMSFILTLTSTLFITLTLISMSSAENIVGTLVHILNVNTYDRTFGAIANVASSHCIGLIGVYDFGTMSPFTLVDNAVVIFTVVFTVLGLFRSFILKLIHVALTNCVDVPQTRMGSQYALFVLFPLGVEFLYVHKIFSIYVYLNMMISVSSHISLSTATMARLLHTEFKKVKDIYIIGILCFFGFVFSVALGSLQRYVALIKSASVTTMLYLGALKSLIIMWVYGVKRFSTDVEFLLSFKPTSYWKLCWTFLPLTLSFLATMRLYPLFLKEIDNKAIITLSWFGSTILVVIFIQLRTVIHYMMRNDLVAAFRSSFKYGPVNVEQRKSRRRYNETTHFRMCTHNCNMLDDRFDCIHQPIVYRRPSSEGENEADTATAADSSVTNIFEEGMTRRVSSHIDVKSLHPD